MCIRDSHQLAPWRALTHELSVPSELDMIVEALLGSNMHGLFVQDRESVRDVYKRQGLLVLNHILKPLEVAHA